MSAADPIRCCDGCGAIVASVAEAEAKAWTRLQITGRYRCPPCVRDLNAVNFPEPPAGNGAAS